MGRSTRSSQRYNQGKGTLPKMKRPPRPKSETPLIFTTWLLIIGGKRRRGKARRRRKGVAWHYDISSDAMQRTRMLLVLVSLVRFAQLICFEERAVLNCQQGNNFVRGAREQDRHKCISSSLTQYAGKVTSQHHSDEDDLTWRPSCLRSFAERLCIHYTMHVGITYQLSAHSFQSNI